MLRSCQDADRSPQTRNRKSPPRQPLGVRVTFLPVHVTLQAAPARKSRSNVFLPLRNTKSFPSSPAAKSDGENSKWRGCGGRGRGASAGRTRRGRRSSRGKPRGGNPAPGAVERSQDRQARAAARGAPGNSRPRHHLARLPACDRGSEGFGAMKLLSGAGSFAVSADGGSGRAGQLAGEGLRPQRPGLRVLGRAVCLPFS